MFFNDLSTIFPIREHIVERKEKQNSNTVYYKTVSANYRQNSGSVKKFLKNGSQHFLQNNLMSLIQTLDFTLKHL